MANHVALIDSPEIVFNMPTYQPKVSTKHVDYPCRECGRKNTKRKPLKMWITGIDGNNAAITQNAVRRPICDDCVNKKPV